MTATGTLPPELTALATALSDRYAIERELGRGGMATVYLARDIKHGRPVAIKVLNPELGAVIGSERFLAEIRVTANLQHPHLLSLFDSGEAAGLLYYVMPFVEGESLRARLDRERQLPVDDAIRIATAIGGALHYAHANGVIHRDLKPENILLQHGQPVVADFGIALAVSIAGGQRVTQTGLSLGTPQYMSPEQATGDRVIDGRSDIYSLGAILYEMLAGDPPHAASTAQATIAKVLTEEVRPLKAIRGSVPQHVSVAVQIALEKLAADRFATAEAFCDALNGHGTAITRGKHAAFAPMPSGAVARVRRAVPWAVAAVAVAGAVWAFNRTLPVVQPLTVFDLALADSVVAVAKGYAFSADGSMLVFAASRSRDVANSMLYMRRRGERAALPIAGTKMGEWPFLSNNERDLLFVRQRKLYRVPLEGGVPSLERDSVTFASAGDRGSVLFEHRGKLWRSVAGTRDPLPVAIDDKMGPRVYAARFAQFLPGEDHVLLTIKTEATDSLRGWGQGLEIAILDVKSGVLTPLGLKGTCARYSATGHLLYVQGGGSLMAVPFSLRTRKITGIGKRIAAGILTGPNGLGMYAADQNGTLMVAYGEEIEQREIAILDTDGRMTKVGGASRRYGSPVISPDGRRVALDIGEGTSGGSDVWIFDIESRTLSRMTSGNSGSRPGGWTADGKKVVYIGRSEKGIPQVYERTWDGSGVAELLMQTTQDPQTVSVDGSARWVAASTYMGANGLNDIVIAPIDSPAAVRALVSGPANESAPSLSSDGTLLAYTSDESGRTEVYVRSTIGAGTRIQVSVDGGTDPMWDRRTGMLFYRSATAILRGVLAGAPDLRVTRRDSLFRLGGMLSDPENRMYDVFADGKRIFAVLGSRQSVKPVVYLGWPDLMR